MKNVDFKVVDSLPGFDCNLLQLPGRSYDQCFNKHPVFLISQARLACKKPGLASTKEGPQNRGRQALCSIGFQIEAGLLKAWRRLGTLQTPFQKAHGTSGSYDSFLLPQQFGGKAAGDVEPCWSRSVYIFHEEEGIYPRGWDEDIWCIESKVADNVVELLEALRTYNGRYKDFMVNLVCRLLD